MLHSKCCKYICVKENCIGFVVRLISSVFQRQPFPRMEIISSKCHNVAKRIPKYKCISLIPVAVFVMLGLVLCLGSMNMFSIGGIYPMEHTSPVGQTLEDMRLEDKPHDIFIPDEVGWERLVVAKQNRRQRLMSRMCKKKGNLFNKLPLKHYIRGWVVDRNHGVAFRATAKVGSTSWLHVMASALSRNTVNNVSSEDIQQFRNYPLSKARLKAQLGWNSSDINELKYAFRPYTKFVFVRHPLSRLLSAYSDKMAKVNFRQRYGDEIMKYSTDKPTSSGKDLTFRDFVRYIIATRKKAKRFNIHWKPLTLLLQPWQFHYNFIGKLETLQCDSQYIFQNLFHDSSLTLPKKKFSRYEGWLA